MTAVKSATLHPQVSPLELEAIRLLLYTTGVRCWRQLDKGKSQMLA